MYSSPYTYFPTFEPTQPRQRISWKTLTDSEFFFQTRNGCTSESFKRRMAVPGENALNQTMKPRHLNMISIGGSIGAGFF
ncbi:unnamed protein product, partial [Diplocarpon coronariae]